jgi:hypothetical protein
VIRFIDLGKQIALDETDPSWPRQFAFFNTIPDQFVKVNGYVVFDSLADLLTEIDQDETVDSYFTNRLLSLLPEWVRTVPAPQNTTQIWGTKR